MLNTAPRTSKTIPRMINVHSRAGEYSARRSTRPGPRTNAVGVERRRRRDISRRRAFPFALWRVG